MEDNFIYQILSSKDHNPHYLNRYFKFIQTCQETNDLNDDSIYYENHHICPKANDLFPEYVDIKKHPWNSVYLTFRQHLIAHVLLWKAYGKSQAIALDCMLGKFNSNYNISSLRNRVVPSSYLIRYLEKVKLESNKERGKYHTGKATYIDSNGNKYCNQILISINNNKESVKVL